MAKVMLATLVGLVCLTSCIYDDDEECACELRFRYDYNMEFADGFPQQVGDINLAIFDEDGVLVDHRLATGGPFGEGYVMDLGLAPGHYKMVAWCGTASDNTSYELPSMTVGTTTMADLRLRLASVGSGACDRMLPALWHGMIEDFEVTGHDHVRRTMELTRDDNTLRILVQDANGDILPGDIDICLTAPNGIINSDNTLPTDNGDIRYTPYVKEGAELENNGVTYTSVVAELGTLRLMEGRENRLKITDNRSGRSVLDINLIQYLSLMKAETYAEMPVQEYLDRENSYQVIVFVSKQQATGTYLAVALQINAWRYIFNNQEL